MSLSGISAMEAMFASLHAVMNPDLSAIRISTFWKGLLRLWWWQQPQILPYQSGLLDFSRLLLLTPICIDWHPGFHCCNFPSSGCIIAIETQTHTHNKKDTLLNALYLFIFYIQVEYFSMDQTYEPLGPIHAKYWLVVFSMDTLIWWSNFLISHFEVLNCLRQACQP